MIVDQSERFVASSGPQEAVAFRISAQDTAHLMMILRSAIYSDKVKAVIREYAANAYDAHRHPSVPPERRERPIRVQLPTLTDPTFAAQDWGPGLSPEDVEGTFTHYGASTKRGTNDAVGYIGIGAKSGFAYTSNFAVVSCHGGRRRTYAAVLDESEGGEMRLIDDSPCDDGDTGVTIKIGVRPADVGEFVCKAREVLRFFTPRPECNVDLGPTPAEGVSVHQAGWVAVMGPVCYPIDVDQLDVPPHVKGVGGYAVFPVGALRVSASREALEYTSASKRVLSARLTEMTDECVRRLVLSTAAMSDWQKRLAYRGMDIFEKFLDASLLRDSVGLHNLDHKRLRVKGAKGKEIPVRKDTRIIFVDDKRAVSGFGLGSHDVVVRCGSEATHDQSWSDLEKLIADVRISGVPVLRTSAMEWVRPGARSGGGGKSSPAHRVRSFAFLWDRDRSTGEPLSSLWEPVKREPQATDVYVILDHFQSEMYAHVKRVRRVLRAFGAPFPPVYGYKVERGGESANRHPGVTFGEWASDLCGHVAATFPDVREIVAAKSYENYTRPSGASLEQMRDKLGHAHPVARLAANIVNAHRVMSSHGRLKCEAVDLMTGRPIGDGDYVVPGGRETPPEAREISDLYPLTSGKFSEIMGRDVGSWIDYFLAIDHWRATSARADDQRADQRPLQEIV